MACMWYLAGLGRILVVVSCIVIMTVTGLPLKLATHSTQAITLVVAGSMESP